MVKEVAVVPEVEVAHLAVAANQVDPVNHGASIKKDHPEEATEATTTIRALSSFLMVPADTEVDALMVVPLAMKAMRDAAHKRNAHRRRTGFRRITGLSRFWSVL